MADQLPQPAQDLTGTWGDDLTLTPKEALYIRHWFECGHDRAEAARRAGYSSGPSPDPATQRARLSRQAWNLHQRADVQEAIRREWIARGADVAAQEVVAVLVSHLRADLGLLFDERGQLDPALVKKHGRLVKSWSETPKTGRRAVTVYSSFEAAVQIGRYLGLWDRDTATAEGAALLASILARVVQAAGLPSSSDQDQDHAGQLQAGSSTAPDEDPPPAGELEQ